MKPLHWGLDRLTLPEYGSQPTAELRAFLKGFFVLNLSSAYYYQIYVCTFFISVILIWGSLIVVKSIISRKWWLFRNQRTSSSRKLYFIPNSTACFIFIEGIFFTFWIPYTFYSRAAFMDQISGRSIGFLLAPLWIPTWLGAWCASIGTLWVSPGILLRSKQTLEKRFSVRKLIPGPTSINSMVIGFPISICLGMFIAGMIGGVKYGEAWDDWRSLDRMLSLQSAEAGITSEQNLHALRVWRGFAEAYYDFSIAWFLLAFGTMTLFVTYTSAAFYLVWTLRSQIKETEALFGRFRVPTTVNLNVEEMERRITVWNSVRASERAANEEETRAAQSTFFPPVKGATAQISLADSPEERSKVLKEALSTILTLSLCVNLATIIFITNTIYMAQRSYEASIDSPRAVVSFYQRYHLVATWNSVIFGGLSFILVLTKTFPTFFESLPKRKRPSPFSLSFVKSVSKLKARSSSSKSRSNPSHELEQRNSIFIVLGQEEQRRRDEAQETFFMRAPPKAMTR